MIVIYKVYGKDDICYGVSSTELSLLEEKEKILNLYLTRNITNSDKYFWIKIKELCENNNIEDFGLVGIDEFKDISNERLNLILRAYRRRLVKSKFKKQVVTEHINIKGKKLKFNDGWEKFARPSIISTVDNPLIRNLGNKYSIDNEEVTDIIKYLSLFIIENMKIKKGTRIPIIGCFKTKKYIFRRESGLLYMNKIRKDMSEDETIYNEDESEDENEYLDELDENN